MNASNSFVFNIVCTASTTICTQMTATLQSAGTRLSAILVIKTPIIVSVTLQSFGSGSSNILGRASPASFSYGRTDQTRPFTGYPQALLKQIDPTTVYAGSDIAARFNSDFNFYFKSSGVPIQSNQFDFEYVACHELTHGLGFTDDLFTSFYGATTTPTFMVPSFYVDSNSGSLFEGWGMPYILNTYMYDMAKQTNIYSYYQYVTNNYTSTGAPLSTLDSVFSQSGAAFTAAQATLNAGESTQLKFISSYNSTPVALFSPQTFIGGSSIAHTNYRTYSKTPDFLMLFTIADYAGVSMDTILSSFNYMGNSVYGPSTFALMASLGWNTLINPNTVVVFYPYVTSLGSSGSVPAYTPPTVY